MDCARRRLSAWLTLAVLPALPLLAQQAVAPEDGNDWAHPPYRILRTTGRINVGGVSPTEMLTAYGIDQISNQGAGQTIALIEAYDNPHAESDLAHFTNEFNLPACTTANGCFAKIYASGKKPKSSLTWATENSLDIEWAHAIAPQAKIILMEAPSAGFKALFHAVHVAIENGATVVSMSFGGPEFKREAGFDVDFAVPNVTFCTSSGDGGHGAQYPAASPNVVAVGGTHLKLGGGGVWEKEVAWDLSGGGLSAFEPEPSYQSGAQSSGKRGIPDVAYDASPSSGVPVYSKLGMSGWGVVGGTSVGSPQWAAIFAITNSLRVALGKSNLSQVQGILYTLPADFHDIVAGNNGTCKKQCKAGPGYDLVTGLGSPVANVLIPALVAGE